MRFEFQLSRIVCRSSSLALDESLLHDFVLVRNAKVLVVGGGYNDFAATRVTSHLSHWLATSVAAHSNGLLSSCAILLALIPCFLADLGLVSYRVCN